MQDATKHEGLIRDSIRNAAVYHALADATDDLTLRQDFLRLRDIEISVVKRLMNGVKEAVDFRAKRFSISLTLWRLAANIFTPVRVARFLRTRLQRALSRHGEEYVRNDLRIEAVESMELLNRLSSDTKGDANHPELDSAVSRTGTLRAAVLGVNDGLVSNAALVLGVAAGSDDANIVLLAGTIALLSGALSMAAGEYISVVSQRDFNENLVRWEKAELLLWREEEEDELVEILKAKGLNSKEAETAAARIMSNPDTALEFHVREELGIDPEELGGSPIWAMISSLVAFSAGAAIPLLPYVIGITGTIALFSSVISATASLLIVGGILGWISSRGAIYGATRMLIVGVFAGTVTYGLGTLIGQQLS